MSDPDTPSPAAPGAPRRRRRWPWILGALALGLAATAILAPRLGAPWIRARLERDLAATLGGPCRIQRLSIGWGGATLEGLEARDDEGRVVLALERAEAWLALGSLLRGTLAGRVDLEAPEVRARRRADGSIDLLDRLAGTPHEPAGGGRRSGKDGEAPPPQEPRRQVLPALELRVRGGHLMLEHEVAASLPGAGERPLAPDATAGVPAGATAARPLRLLEVRDLAFEALLGPAGGPLALTAELRDDGRAAGRVEARGALEVGTGRVLPADLGGAFALSLVDLELPAWQPLLDGAPPGLAGRISGEVELGRQLADRWRLWADLEATGLVIPRADGPPLEPGSVRLDLAAGLLPDGQGVDVTSLVLESEALSGDVTGTLRRAPEDDGWMLQDLAGEVAWVPDRVAALLGPAMALPVGGSQPQPLRLACSLPLGHDLRHVLAQFVGEAELGLGILQVAGLETTGVVQLRGGDGGLAADATLAAGPGRARLRTTLDPSLPRPDHVPTSHATVSLEDLALSPALRRLAEGLHPGLAGARDGLGVAGRVDAELAVDWSAPLPLGALPPAGGWLAPLRLEGTLQLRQVVLGESGLLGELLTALDEPSRQVELAPLSFVVAEGRVAYREPWPWRVGGTETTFGGSVGLDGSLDLRWNVPVTRQLAKRQRLLASQEGEVLSIPLVGSLAAPRLLWQETLAALVEDATQAEIGTRLEEGLGGLMGGDADPARLLEEADALWEAGRREEARVLYKRLKDDYPLTLPYQLNKDRIKDRARKRQQG